MSAGQDDAAAIALLRANGVDLDVPHMLRHYLYVPLEEIATKIAPVIKGIGFDVETSASGDRWLVLISGEAMISVEELAAFRETFEGLAAKVNGSYDGWEV